MEKPWNRPEAEDSRRQLVINDAYEAAQRVISSGVLNRPGDLLFEAAVTTFLIQLSDLLQKAALEGKRVAFCDDVSYTSKPPKDVTSLIRDARNAAAHVGSDLPDFTAGRLRFGVWSGYCPKALVTPDDVFGCDYADDVAIQYGPIRVYLVRHLGRAWNEVQQVFVPPWNLHQGIPKD